MGKSWRKIKRIRVRVFSHSIKFSFTSQWSRIIFRSSKFLGWSSWKQEMNLHFIDCLHNWDHYNLTEGWIMAQNQMLQNQMLYCMTLDVNFWFIFEKCEKELFCLLLSKLWSLSYLNVLNICHSFNTRQLHRIEELAVLLPFHLNWAVFNLSVTRLFWTN